MAVLTNSQTFQPMTTIPSKPSSVGNRAHCHAKLAVFFSDEGLDWIGLSRVYRLHQYNIPYILAYKSLPRISRPLKSEPVWSKIIDPRISRRWFLGTCTESSRYTHSAV